MALDKVDLSRLNDKKRAEKRNQNDVENRGFFSGVIARGLRGNAIDKAHAKSEALIDQYGGDAAKSRGFMAYDKQDVSQAPGKPTAKLSTDKPKSPAKNMPVGSGRGGVTKKAKGGKISEYGGKEMYKSKGSMMKHEGSESKAVEKMESKMAMGGKCRGMGAATKGGKYRMG